MKRQSSAVSPSTSRRETAPEKIHVKTIGCMSGILHLISNSSSRRRRRFLTFGKKQIENHDSSVSVSTVTATSNSQPESAKKKKSVDVCGLVNARLSSEVPRNPTLPAEIHRSNTEMPAENRREAPALVARLMGLEAVPSSPELVVEKRQKLLGALQRCDEDLKALKKIIDAVRSTDPLPVPSSAEMCCLVVSGEFTRSPLSPNLLPLCLYLTSLLVRHSVRIATLVAAIHSYRPAKYLPESPADGKDSKDGKRNSGDSISGDCKPMTLYECRWRFKNVCMNNLSSWARAIKSNP